jgi:hypothetical protein
MFYEKLATLLVKPGTDRPRQQFFNEKGSLLLTSVFLQFTNFAFV